MKECKNKTIVTACDHNYIWGAMLLGLSLRYFKHNCSYHVLGYNLTAADINCLQSISGTKVFPLDKSNARSMCTQKPLAIATADTELIIWMDSDCIVTENVDQYLIAPKGKLQIRHRGTTENAGVYRNQYHKHDIYGAIPQAVLQIWKRDVADLDTPHIATACQTNCFVLTRDHLPFIDLWHRQMNKVLPTDSATVYLANNEAYAMTDESVINSLFAFSSSAPPTAEYLLDKDSTAYCAHFGLQPKPWKHWTKQSLIHYQLVQDLIIWAKASNILLPSIPVSFDPHNRAYELLRATLIYHFRSLRYYVSNLSRALIRAWK